MFSLENVTALWNKRTLLLFSFAAVSIFIAKNAYSQSKHPTLEIPMGHQQKINSVAFSEDGKLIATGSGDNTFIIWDAKTGHEIRKVNAGAPVQQVIFCPDGSCVITITGQNEAQYVSVDKPIFKKWDITNGKLVTQFPFTGLPGVEFVKSSGNLLVPGYSEDLSKRKQTDMDKSLEMMKDPEKYAQQQVNSINYDSIEKNAEKKLDEIMKNTPKPDYSDKKSVEEYSKKIMAQMLGGNSSLNPLGNNYTILDSKSFKPVGNLNRKFGKACLISYNNNDYLLAAEKIFDANSRVTDNIDVWELQKLLTNIADDKAVPWKRFPVSRNPYFIAVSAKKGFFANDVAQQGIQLWQLDKTTPLTLLKPTGKSLSKIEFSADGNILYAYSMSYVTGYIEGWNTTTLQRVTSFQLPPHYYTNLVNLSPAGDYFTIASRNALIKITGAGDSTGGFKGHSASSSYFGFSNNDKKVYVNYGGFPDMSEYIVTSLEAGVEYDAYTNKKVLTKTEEDKLVKEQLKKFPPSKPGSYDGYNLNWDLVRGGAVVQKAAPFSFDHQTISADKNYQLINERFESGNRETNPYLLQMMQLQIEGISKETADKLKKYRDTGSTYFKVMFSGDFNGPVTLLINKKTKDSISLIKIDSLDWIMVLKDGYYMTSKNGAKALSYVRGLQVFPFEQFDIQYNRPDLVLKAIGLADPALIKAYKNAYMKRIKKLEIDTTQFSDDFEMPEADFENRSKIEYDQKTGKLNLVIAASDNNNTLNRFNVWINEVPVFGMNGKSIKEDKSKKLNTSLEISLSEGLNRIETSVMNSKGVQSYRVPLYVNYTPHNSHDHVIHFVGIGIDQFENSKYNLQYSTKDIRDLCEAFKKKYANNIIIDTLFNENVTIEKVKTLKQTLKRTSPDDKVIIAYSGHGLLSKEYDYYLSTYKVNFIDPVQNGLPYEELENLLDSIPTRKKLMLIDACHSGEVDKDELAKMVVVQKQLDPTKKGVIVLADTSNKRLGMKNSFDLMQELFVNVGINTGATIISAAAGTQFALEKNDLKNGVFTYSILEYMQQHEHATLFELKRYVNDRVTELTQGLQVPTARSETIDVDWNVW